MIHGEIKKVLKVVACWPEFSYFLIFVLITNHTLHKPGIWHNAVVCLNTKRWRVNLKSSHAYALLFDASLNNICGELFENSVNEPKQNDGL